MNNYLHGAGIGNLFDRWSGYWPSEIEEKTDEVIHKVDKIVDEGNKKKTVDKEVTGLEVTSTGIMYAINFPGGNSEHANIKFIIDGEEYFFDKIISGYDNDTEHFFVIPSLTDEEKQIGKSDVNNSTFRNHPLKGKSKDFKQAVNQMFGKIHRILKSRNSRDKKIQDLLSDCRVSKEVDMLGEVLGKMF